jgi:PAS domain S-box-containing protein
MSAALAPHIAEGLRAAAQGRWMTRNRTLALIAVTMVATFIDDLLLELGIAAGVPYVVPVVASLWLRNTRATLYVALLATALTVVGLLLSPEGGEAFQVLLNRGFAMIAIWSVAAAAQIGTQLRRAEETLAESSLEAAVFQSAGDPTQAIGLDGRVVALNAAGARMLGVSAEEAIGYRARDVARISRADGSRYAAEESLIALVMSDGQERSAVGDVIFRRDGTRVEVERTVSPLVDAKTGELAGVVQVMHDVTAQRQIERAKSEFLAMTSHELKTPLTAIHAVVGLAASGQLGELSDQARTLLATAKTNSDRLLQLVQEIVDLERLTLGEVDLKIGPCSSEELQNNVATMLSAIAAEAGVEIEVESEAVSFNADRERLIQALVNLTSNAIKFSPDSSTVRLSSYLLDSDVCFEVRDSGPGIADADISRIFEKFQQADNSDTRLPGGSGLGLTITKGIVEQHGGRIWVESELGEGSVFRFTLPLRL